MQTSFKTRSSKRYYFRKKALLHLLERVKTCRSNFHCFKCKGRHHVCICTFSNASGNQNSHDSKNSSGDGFAQIDKQNDDEKKTTVASKNIASVHPSLNLYVYLALLQTSQAHLFSCDTKNGKKMRILCDSSSQMTFISETARSQWILKTVIKQNISVKSFGNNENMKNQIACRYIKGTS